MTKQEQEQFKQTMYAEALRYMSNAKETLSRSKEDGRFYLDSKYVRSASGIAYLGMLLALDAIFVLRGVEMPKKKRRAIEFYKSNAAKIDGRLINELNSAYSILHLDGYYDGNLNIKVISEGFKSAYNIIDLIKPNNPLPQPQPKSPSWTRKMYLMFAALFM
jgi:hypothetical protein